MDDVADRAGVSKPVLYQHFPSKLDLYLALLDAACEEVVGAVRGALASTNVNKERVTASTEAFYRYVADPGGAYRLVFESDLTKEPAVRERVDRVTSSAQRRSQTSSPTTPGSTTRGRGSWQSRSSA